MSYDQRKTVHTALYQHHAPTLDETGLVEYDATRGEITLTDAGQEVDLYLEAVRGRGITWSTYFLALSGFAASLVLAVSVGVDPIDAAGSVLSGILAVSFLFSSIVFAYSTRQTRLGTDGAPPEVTDDAGG